MADIRKDFSVFCVADGMGGYTNGERASEMVITFIREWIGEKSPASLRECIDQLEVIIHKANEQIFRQFNVSETSGTTASVLVIWDDLYALLTCGDSRVYLHRGESVQQLSRDDVWQNMPGIAESLTQEEIRHHPSYGKLTAAIGIEESCSINVSTGEVQAGDCFLLCSDGVYKLLSDEELLSYTGRLLTSGQIMMKFALSRMADRINKKGAPDNYSAIIVKIK